MYCEAFRAKGKAGVKPKTEVVADILEAINEWNS
jgi:hypothetical protein